MPTAADLLEAGTSTDSATDDNRFVISEDLRVITVPEGQEILGVTNDADVRRVWFTMPLECDGTDLSHFTPFVNYKNAANQQGRYECTDLTPDEGSLTFSWIVPRLALTTAGDVQFNVDLKLFDTDEETVLKEFNTAIAQMTVLQGIVIDNYNPARAYADEIRGVLTQLVASALDSRHVLVHKGSVPTYAELPASGVAAGSVYDVAATGRNYVWTGSVWDELGGVDNLTVSSATDAQIDAMFA